MFTTMREAMGFTTTEVRTVGQRRSLVFLRLSALTSVSLLAVAATISCSGTTPTVITPTTLSAVVKDGYKRPIDLNSQLSPVDTTVGSWVQGVDVNDPLIAEQLSAYDSGEEADWLASFLSHTQFSHHLKRDANHSLGWLSAAKESGGKSGVISTGKAAKGSDPGGISYGRHQIASKTGTMKRFINSPEATAYVLLHKYAINSTMFKKAWKAYSRSESFQDAQFIFLKRTHYLTPLDYANKMGFKMESPLLQEALFSLGIHAGAGGYNKKKQKWTGAIGVLRAVAHHNDLHHMDATAQLKVLYVARWLRFRHSTISTRHYQIRKNRFTSEFEMLTTWAGRKQTISLN